MIFCYIPKNAVIVKTKSNVKTSAVPNHTKLFVKYYYTLKQKATYKTINISIYPQAKDYIQNCFDKCQYTPKAKATYKTMNTYNCLLNTKIPSCERLYMKQ